MVKLYVCDEYNSLVFEKDGLYYPFATSGWDFNELRIVANSLDGYSYYSEEEISDFDLIDTGIQV